jgi:hypothetical protein
MKIITYFDEKPYILVVFIFSLFIFIGCIVVGPTAFFNSNTNEQQKKEKVDETSLNLSPTKSILRDMIQHQIMH